MKNEYIVDTMAIVLRLENRKLSSKVKSIFAEGEKGNCLIYIPAMVLAEIGYLSERNKIDTDLKEFKSYCLKFPSIFIEPMTDEILYKSFEIDDIPELHDRIIAGSAYLKNISIITNDPVITNSNFVSVVW